MCGIVGIVAPSSDGRRDCIRLMNQSLVHRGPDEDGFYEDEAVALAMRRLSIQDVAHGHQPAYSESGEIVVVFNGELYNVAELRQLLIGRGHAIASHSDTDCIPHLYEEFGVNFVDHMRGMFAVAIWDKRTRTLTLARDRVGKKPLYWTPIGTQLLFGSELKAILCHPDVERIADPVAINHYLTYQYVPAPLAAVAGVQKLPPGHVLVHDQSGTKVRRYWQLNYADRSSVNRATDRELAEELQERILDCVRVRMVSERPLGAFLSGGLDSSAVVGAMARIGASEISTFSIGFDEDSHNELPYARRVAERYNTKHHEMVVRPNALEILPRLARSFDEPYSDSSAIPSWYLADMASQHVVVALNGDGGDEALGGYSRYLRYLRVGERRLPGPVARALLRAGVYLRSNSSHGRFLRKASSAAIILGASDPAVRYARMVSIFRPEEKLLLASPDFSKVVLANDSNSIIERLWAENRNTDVANKLMAIDTHSYLPGDLLPKVDITTMSVSLEARSPFLDHTLLEWSAALPGSRKIAHGSGKHLLKLALDGWIDPDLIHRTKQGFGVPLGAWFRGPLRSMVFDLLTDETASGRGYFDPAAVSSLVNQHMAGIDLSPQIYSLLMLELWHREVLK